MSNYAIVRLEDDYCGDGNFVVVYYECHKLETDLTIPVFKEVWVFDKEEYAIQYIKEKEQQLRAYWNNINPNTLDTL